MTPADRTRRRATGEEAAPVPRAAVCIIRVELQAERMHYTVRTVRNLDRSLYAARSDIPRVCADTEEVLQVTGEFLRSLEHELHRSG